MCHVDVGVCARHRIVVSYLSMFFHRQAACSSLTKTFPIFLVAFQMHDNGTGRMGVRKVGKKKEGKGIKGR